MKEQWRSIADLNKEEAVDSFKEREFQEGASELGEGVSRRNFLKLLGGSAALAGLTGCSVRKPYQKIYPYAKKVEHIVPGKPVFYATSMAIQGDVSGILVETHEGRPTKIEGNPDYPGNLGGSSVFQQSSVLDLYDPSRLSHPELSTKSVPLNQFKDWMLEKRSEFKATQGKGVYLVTETSASPTFHNLLNTFLRKYPQAKVFRYESINNDEQVLGLESLTYERVVPDYAFDKADVVVSFGHDFLGSVQDQVKHIQDFATRRDPDSSDASLNRLYVIEERMSVTGAKSDHHFPVKRSHLLPVLSRLLYFVSKKVSVSLDSYVNGKFASVELPFITDKELSVIADDLVQHRGRSIVSIGESYDRELHQLAFLLNSILNNNFKTVFYNKLPFRDHAYSQKSSLESVRELVDDLNANKVSTLVVFGGDLAYTAPADLELPKAIIKAKDRVHLTALKNKTSRLCNWVIPRSHFLESWDDLVSDSGVFSIVQPVIKRQFESLGDNELLSLLANSYRSDYSLIKQSWSSLSDSRWKKALHEGYVLETNVKQYPYVQSVIDIRGAGFSDHLELSFIPDYKVLDGRFSNNGWLQELPDPLTKLTWDNGAFISPRTATQLGLKTGDLVTVQADSLSLDIPVFIAPGTAANTLAVSLGYGKETGLSIENEVGFDAGRIRSSKSFNSIDSVTLIKRQGHHDFATTQDHGYMEGRPHFRYASVSEYKKKRDFAVNQEPVPYDKSLWEAHSYDAGYQWGMVIDLNKCTACNACVTSCQAENNIPIVGKEEVLNGREMHWIRVDRYYEGDTDNPKVVEQPVTCLQCENAPCEQVCPVAATVHDEEGLNAMVYNRCIGTRYCSDNCPAKVRRFNFFDYNQRNPHATKKERFHFFDYMKEPAESLQKQFNPDVTVRMRGVMEKCTYCVQRIKAATQNAANESREIRDGEVVTACQQACPADAIVMGNILDENSEVARKKKNQRNYSILEQLLLNARTTYLAAVFNPNPLLEKEKEAEHHVEYH